MLTSEIRQAVRVFLTTVAALLCASSVASGGEQWAWFRGVSAQDPVKWWLVQGNAEVTISGKRFDALLRDSSDPSVTWLTLRGTVVGGRVKVNVTTHGTDAPDYEVAGTLKRWCPVDGRGREALILSDGLNVIGLVRDMTVGVPCKPTQQAPHPTSARSRR